jgi:hypothetical protein
MFKFLSSSSKACIIIILFSCVVGCEKTEVITPSNTYALDEAQLKAKISMAESGNIEAMNQLVSYYWIHQENGKERGLYWLKRSAVAGDQNARKSFFDYCEEHISKSIEVCEKSLNE